MELPYTLHGFFLDSREAAKIAKKESYFILRAFTSSREKKSHFQPCAVYHIVFVPKKRRKMVFGEIRKQLGPIFHELARQKECKIHTTGWTTAVFSLALGRKPG